MDVEQEIRDIWSRLDALEDLISGLDIRVDNFLSALEEVSKGA